VKAVDSDVHYFFVPYEFMKTSSWVKLFLQKLL